MCPFTGKRRREHNMRSAWQNFLRRSTARPRRINQPLTTQETRVRDNMSEFGAGPVLVTGGNSGIGLGVAEAVAATGRPVAIVGRSADKCAAAAEQVSRGGSRDVVAIAADVTSPEQLDRAVQDVTARWGTIEGLVTAAGVLLPGGLQEVDLADFRNAFEANVLGTWLAVRTVTPGMVDVGFGRIVTIGSVLATVGAPQRAAYAATKGAVTAMTRSLALELAGSGVTINCISPGPVRSAMNAASAGSEAQRAFTAKIPLGRWGTPDEIAHMVVPLLGAGAGFTTGSVVHVDGGYTSQ